MYVCICNGYREAQLHEVARSGVRSAREAYHALGAGPRCGRCVAAAQEMLDGLHTPRPDSHSQPSGGEAVA
jgi:bacterioferritin-associated ferredoxin